MNIRSFSFLPVLGLLLFGIHKSVAVNPAGDQIDSSESHGVNISVNLVVEPIPKETAWKAYFLLKIVNTLDKPVQYKSILGRGPLMFGESAAGGIKGVELWPSQSTASFVIMEVPAKDSVEQKVEIEISRLASFNGRKLVGAVYILDKSSGYFVQSDELKIALDNEIISSLKK